MVVIPAPSSVRRRGTATLAAALLALSLGAAPAAAATTFTPGAAGGGDPYFPRQGNGGYDVQHYALALDYTPRRKHLVGTATITARATQNLSRFDLDLRRTLRVDHVTVDGRPARFAQPTTLVQELVVTPPRGLPTGRPFTVVVHYDGTPKPLTDPDGSIDGWIATNDGAFVGNQPQGAPTWFPSNDVVSDKASLDTAITVPAGLTAVSNGAPAGHCTHDGRTTWRWHLRQPVSTYLMTATLGRFHVHTGHTPHGVPYFVAVDPRQEAKAMPVLNKLPAMVDYFANLYGRYPFDWTGAIVDDAAAYTDSDDDPYAIETASRPLFDRATDETTLAHELAHQWFGDDVSPRKWRDIWINEGFAEVNAWIWAEHTGEQTVADRFADEMRAPADDDDTWEPPPGNPGSAQEFLADSVYIRGPATLAALRQRIGPAEFTRVLHGWVRTYAGRSVTPRDFIAYTERETHRDLRHFFQVWLYDRAKPRSW